MIIRPACEREYTALPNAILNDRSLSADTRAMLALVLSKPKSWELRPGPLARALSRDGGKPLGRTRLSRMFDEARAAGYMARSAEQGHQDDGRFGKYVYFVGMPDDVKIAVERSSVAFLPHARKPHTADPHAADPHTANQRTDQKVKNIQTTNSKNPPPTAPAEQAETPGGRPKENGAANCENIGSLFKSDTCVALRPVPKQRRERPEIIQDRIANRLGSRGWAVLMAMTASELDQLTARERAGTLTDEALALVHARFPAPYRRGHDAV